MASFMDYYQDELRKRGARPGASPEPARWSSLADVPGGSSSQPEGEPQSPINWLFDILDRPRRAVGNTVEAIANLGAPKEGETALDLAGALVSAPVRGLFSTNPEDQKPTGKIMESVIDRYGNAYDPTYTDTDDNVDPVAKGALGFVGDVALDPISYIPGALLAKGAKTVTQGVDRGLTAISEGLVGADRVKGASSAASRAAAAAKAAEQTVKVGQKGKKSRLDPENNPFEEATNLDPGDFRPSRAPDSGKVERLETFGTDLARVEDILRPSVPRQPRPAGVPERMALESAADAAPGAARAASSPIDDLLAGATRVADEAPAPKTDVPPAGAALPDDVVDASGAIPMGGGSFADLIRQSPNRQGIEDTLTRIANDVEAARTPKPFNAQEFITASKDKQVHALPGDVPRAYSLLDLAKIASTNAGTPRGQMATKIVVAAVDEAKKAAGQAQLSAADVLSVFTRARELDAQGLQNALGDDLYDYLAKVNTPAKLHKTLQSIRAVIEPDDAIMDTLRNMNGDLSRLLSERLGLPRASKAKTPKEAAELSNRLLSENEPYQHALAEGLAKALDAELVDLAEKGYAYYIRKMGMKVARTSKKAGAGKGRYVDQLNGFSQYTMLRNQNKAIELAALDIMRARGIKGMSHKDLYSAQRTDVYKQAVMRVMDDQAKLLDDIGAHMSVGVGADTVQLSMNEIYRGLLSAADELGMPRTIDQGLFNYGTQAAPTAVSDAVAKAIAGGSRDDVLAILTDPRKYGNKGLIPGSTGKMPNNLVDSGHGWGFNNRKTAYDVASELTGNARDARKLVRTLESGRTSKTTGAKRQANHYYLQYKSGDRNYMAEALADTIMQARGGLKVRAAENEAAFISRTRQEIHKLSSDELAKIEAFLKHPAETIRAIRAFKARQKRIEADAAKINASADAVDGAEDVVDASLGEELVSTMTAAGKAEPQYASAETALDLRHANETFTGGAWQGVKDDFDARPADEDLVDPVTGLRQNEEWAEVVDETTPLHGDWRDMLYDEAEEFITKSGKGGKKSKKGRKGPYVDLSEDAPAMVDAFGQRIIDPYGIMKHKVSQWFNQNHMAANAMRTAHAWQNSMAMRTAYVSHQLNAINRTAKKLSPDQDLLPSVFNAIQRGVQQTDPRMAELEDMIQGVLGDFFDLNASGSMGNVFLRTTSKPELVNAMLKQKGIDQAFDLDLARRTAAEKRIPLDQAISDQWRDWKVNDPLDFMNRMAQAREELAFNKGTAMSFIDLAKSKGALSNKKAPGYVRIQASGDSRFAAHLPDDVYVKKELAQELQRVETVFRTSREFSGQLGDFVRNTYAPLLNAWKFAITLPRPGHHIRNLIGDTSVTWMRRGNQHFAQSWKDAVKLLGSRGNYTDVNMLEAANRYGIKDLPKGGDEIFKTDRFGSFTADELYAALAEGGALPTYHIGEDFVNAGGKLNSVLGKVTLRDTRVGEQLGKLSEGRDHLARFQHFIQILRQDSKAWKGSREDLIEHATREVIKYHPDASLLTTMESKLRLAIPFYSWFGKIIPALVESMIRNPGRLTTFNKASYNWAVANGLNPESLSDPFPDDQLFPSFLTEQALGPQFMMGAGMLGAQGGEYIRMNPGIAHLDVMNTLGADPLRGLAGMTSPIVRVPAELLSGGSWGTGAQINDWSDYLDSSIPGINYLANVSGISPTGSVESLLSGEGLDPQAQVEKGNKTDFDKALSVANWITGLGIQNLSRPNYINYAEIERRNAASEK